MNKTLAALGAAALLIGGLGAAAPATAATSSTTPYCGITWGSLPKVDEEYSQAALTNVRAGRHECFDRLVLDFSGAVDGYRIEYVDAVAMDGSGQLVPLAGGARLRIVALSPAHDTNYQPTYSPADPANLVDVSCFSTFRQVAWAGSFEGQTTIGLGVRARLPFRAFILDGGPGGTAGGSRLIVDVAHRW
ncbi:AMIN-like domain-containing (lipo)protein [Sinomonas mesophila]|uniref:AMIN-like domain-containing (lipo)protein n=1 Tax=Sinomonas mesophila TaxID=1531955 RepID=UPI000984960A|nr:hypothetical protein [Sinomonas mesophila]